MFSLDEYILVNQWVQGARETAVLVDWYQGSPERQSEIRCHLVELCKQARASGDDGAQAVRNSAIKPGRSACVLLASGVSAEIFQKLVNLKIEDGADVFVLLLHLLKIADDRRRANEVPGSCIHWWHRDLSDPVVLTKIRKDHARGNL